MHWSRENSIQLLNGRNNIRAVVHTNGVEGIWVVSSVMEQFYNTIYSTDGVNFQFPDNACALTDVDVRAMVAWRGYLFLFTTACHDYSTSQETATPCRPGDKVHNRIYYSQNGQSWLLARRPYTVDLFLRPVYQRYGWSGEFEGDKRPLINMYHHLLEIPGLSAAGICSSAGVLCVFVCSSSGMRLGWGSNRSIRIEAFESNAGALSL